ncbi:vegetative cell wall protein gp1-like [Miscanthus floridulus]|uniref:vegetative cell wall protein gp1-like n=1 Tax=Miscanthus floridulus TaxID=154761 RepID=UPI003457FC0D
MHTHPKLAFFNSLSKNPSLSPPRRPFLSLSTPAPPLPLSPLSLSTTPLPPGFGRRRHPSLPSIQDPAVAGEEDPGSPLLDGRAPLPASPRYPPAARAPCRPFPSLSPPPSLSTAPLSPESGRRQHPSLPNSAVVGEEDPRSPLPDDRAPLPTSSRYPPAAPRGGPRRASRRGGSPQRSACAGLDDVDLRSLEPRMQNG